jgi:hypothetical protein
MSAFDGFFSDVVSGAKDLARTSLDGFVDQAEGDSKAFILTNKTELEKWGKQLANREITRDQFEFLVMGLKDLTEMHALTEAGVAEASVQRFRDKLINLVINAAFKNFIPI